MNRNKQVCYNCHSSQYEHFISENGFELVKCSNCGILYVLNPPTEEEIDVATRTGIHKGQKVLDANVRYRKTADSFYRGILSDIFPNEIEGLNSWLDVGCGYGEFMETVQEFFEDKILVYGSEPNLKKSQAAQARGLNVSFFDLDDHKNKYDVVSLMNVYSHLPNPFEFLKSLKKVVASNGLILLQTADISNVTPESLIKPAGLPDHLSFVTESALIEMFERLGLKVERIVKVPSLLLTINQFTKEFIKLFIPNKSSFLKYYFMPKATKSKSMFILARN